jgi:hypothetical protein
MKLVRLRPRGEVRTTVLAIGAAIAGGGCRDVSGFTTSGDQFEGAVVQADFVRAGVDRNTRLCMTIDANHLQGSPGAIWTSDGRFHAAALRPIPQIWYDPLSTLSFGEGRLKNLVYMASATTHFADGNGDDVVVVVSLMQSSDIEIRLVRGAPALAIEGGTGTGADTNLFAVFDLSRKPGRCSY